MKAKVEPCRNTRQVADLLALDVSTVRPLCRTGRLRHVRISDGPKAHIVVPESAIQEFLDRGMVPTARDAATAAMEGIAIPCPPSNDEKRA